MVFPSVQTPACRYTDRILSSDFFYCFEIWCIISCQSMINQRQRSYQRTWYEVMSLKTKGKMDFTWDSSVGLTLKSMILFYRCLIINFFAFRITFSTFHNYANNSNDNLIHFSILMECTNSLQIMSLAYL